jgi:hypothetical protein
MSGPQGPDQQWQPPAQGGDPAQEATRQIPSYPPTADYSQYQQPADQAYQPYAQQPGAYGQPGQYPQYPQPGQYGQPVGYPGQYGQPGQYPQYPQPGQYPQYGQPGQPGQYSQYPEQYLPDEQSGKKTSRALIGVAGAVAAALVAAVLVLGFLWPGWFVTTKLDVHKAQAGVQQVLSDETNGYGAKNVKDVTCNHGQDPVVKKGGSFDCDVSIDGAPKHVTVTFQDGKGTYEVGRPQ